MMKVGIFLPNWVGDVVMATPTLRALRRYMGREATFIGMMKPYVEGVLQGTSWLDEIWFYDRLSPDPEMRPAALTRRIYRSRLDLVVLLTNDFLSAFISWLGRAKKRVGYVRNRRGPFLTLKLSPSMANGKFVPTPTLDYYLQLAYALGCPTESWKMELATADEDERMADQVGEVLGLRSDGKVVLFNPSGAYGQRRWPDEYFSELANRVVKELTMMVDPLWASNVSGLQGL
jgi:heptosyltransferase-2